MSWKRMIFGEKTPDKNDPKYKERYKKEVEAGRKTARFLRIDKLSAWLQTFASSRPKTFLSIIISVMAFCLCYNIYIVVQVFSRPDHTITATQIQRQRLEKRKARQTELMLPTKSNNENDDEDRTDNEYQGFIEGEHDGTVAEDRIEIDDMKIPGDNNTCYDNPEPSFCSCRQTSQKNDQPGLTKNESLPTEVWYAD